MNQAEPSWLLDVQGVCRVFDDVIIALQDVSLRLAQGERVALLGPSGSGKSTLLSLIAHYDTPDAGQILIGGRSVQSYSQSELHTRWIGMLFQQFYLLDNLSPLENIELPLIPTSGRAQRREKSRELLGRVGLEARQGVSVRNLSAGERQRIAFCRSIANKPALLLADEPTGNLDSVSKCSILELMQDNEALDDGALLVATHDSAVADICHHIVCLKDGRVVQ